MCGKHSCQKTIKAWQGGCKTWHDTSASRSANLQIFVEMMNSAFCAILSSIHHDTITIMTLMYVRPSSNLNCLRLKDPEQYLPAAERLHKDVQLSLTEIDFSNKQFMVSKKAQVLSVRHFSTPPHPYMVFLSHFKCSLSILVRTNSKT